MAKKLSTSPKGRAVWPHLNKADTKFKADGEYHVKLRVPEKDPKAVALMKAIDDGIAAAVTEAKEAAQKQETPKKVKAALAAAVPCEDKPYSFETNDQDERTGNVLFTFKLKAKGKSRKTGEEFTQKPAFFSAAGTPISPDPKVGAGTEMIVSYELITFPPTGKVGAGVSLRLKAVQILELIEWGSGNAEYFGFEAQAAADDDDDDGEDEEEEEEADEDEEEEEEAEAPAPAPATTTSKKVKGAKKEKDDF